MKNLNILISVLLICIFYCSPIFSQNSVPEKKSQTYAVIIGISQYENLSTPKLEFAHRDAAIFADFLKSEKGGSIPEENIRLLLNEEADIAAIHNALDWLKSNVKENDQAFFYFSGHGDIENKKDLKLGYLLGYNTPPNNYLNNAISIKDINQDANFISLEKKGKMVFILDACHSGVLAGNFFKGKNFVNKQLQTVLNNEVRLTACAANQEAAEGLNWGGGRGAFSYYLIKGLNGFAEKNNDEVINLKELASYIDSCFVFDNFLISENHPQNPVIDGHPAYPLSFGAGNTFATFKNNFNGNSSANNLPSSLAQFSRVKMQPIDTFFVWLDTTQVEVFIDFKKYGNISLTEFSNSFVDDIILKKPSINFSNVKNQLVNNTGFQKRFIERLVQYVHKQSQNMIIEYLLGNLGELRKRDYYYLSQKEYEMLLDMIQVARKLVPEEHHLAHILNVNYYYLAGLIARINMATSNNPDSLLVLASNFQNEAFKLEPFAAYIQNELGNLDAFKNDFKSAKKHYDLASEISPTWAIPWVNLISVNFAQKNLKEARKAIQKAEELQPYLEYTEINAGLVYELEKNWLAAESSYLLAIEKNSSHYLPYERLGFVNIIKADFVNAQLYFEKAELRKKGVNDEFFKQGIQLSGPNYRFFSERKFVSCEDYISDVNIEMNYFYNSFYSFYKSQGLYDSSAVVQLKKGLKIKPNMPLAKHILGKMQFLNGEWLAAKQNLLEAKRNYLSDIALEIQLINILKIDTTIDSDLCFLEFFKYFQYDSLENEYLLAEIYQKLDQPDIAIEKYKEIIASEHIRIHLREPFKHFTSTNAQLLGSIKLALLFEKLDKFDLAESTYLEQIAFNDRNFYHSACYDFYNRMINKFPRDYQWYEKFGLWIHRFLGNSISVDNYIRINESEYYYPKRAMFPTLGVHSMVTVLGTNEIMWATEKNDIEIIAYNKLVESTKLNGSEKQSVIVLKALADLALWVESKYKAIDYHHQILRQEENYQSRNSLISLYNYSKNYPAALRQLIILDQQKLLKTKQKLQLAQYLILSNKVKIGFNKMKKLDSLDIENITKNYQVFMNNNPKVTKADRYLKNNFKRIYQNDTLARVAYDSVMTNRESLYIKARQFAQHNKSIEAILTLKESLEKGFNFNYVLEKDPAWGRLRGTKDWKNAIQLSNQQPLQK